MIAIEIKCPLCGHSHKQSVDETKIKIKTIRIFVCPKCNDIFQASLTKTEEKK